MRVLGTRARIVATTTVVVLDALLGLRGFASAQGGQAFAVDSTADAVDAAPGDGRCATAAGACTLRAAVQEVEALPVVPGAGREVVVPAGVYRQTIPAGGELTSPQPVVAAGDLDVTTRVTITGAGADRTVIDGTGAHRMIDVHANGFARTSRVALRNGRAEHSGPTGHVHGGAIHNHGVLELLESTVSDSVAHAGSPWGGGGITNAGNGTATLRNVTNAKNGTTYFGGAVENGGPMTMTNVTVTANTAPAGQGAGIASGVGFFVGSGAAAA